MIKYQELESFINNNYHQDIFLDYNTHKEIWDSYWTDKVTEKDFADLFNESSELLKLSKSEIKNYFEGIDADALYFETEEEAYNWLLSFNEYLEERIKELT